MKTLFVCDVCGEIYESEAEAKHQVYPDRIKVRFDNITAIYKYESGIPIIGCSTRE